MSCRQGLCACGPFQASDRPCQRDKDCDCKVVWPVVAVFFVGVLLLVSLLAWGLSERRKEHLEALKLRDLLERLHAPRM